MVRYTIVASKVDHASMKMRDALIELHGFEPTDMEYDGSKTYRYRDIDLILSNKDVLHVDDLDKYFSPKAFIFISRHESESGIPTLTAHFTGNFTDDASHGGNPNELGWTYPSLLKEYTSNLGLSREKVPMYDIVLEGTHHGPTSLSKPCLFVEIGSSEEQWVDERAAKVVTDSLMKSLVIEPRTEVIGLGIGGPHYSRKFTKLLFNRKIALAGYVPKHSLTSFRENILKQLVEKSIESIEYAVIDSKGLSIEKERVLEIVNTSNLEVMMV